MNDIILRTIETVSVNGNNNGTNNGTNNDSEMEIFLFSPSGDRPHPGLILAHHLPVGHTGIENDEFTLKTAERLARNGYKVAVPFIFHWWPKEDSMESKRDAFRDDWTSLDLQATYKFLAGCEDVDETRIGILGHCWGGRVAWLGACIIAEFKACAIFYGGRVKLPLGPDPAVPAVIDLAPNITCPVMGFFGNDDGNPSPEDVDDYSAALSAANVPHTFHRYDGAGHAFQNFPTPERYNETASEDAWGKLIAFLNNSLKSPS